MKTTDDINIRNSGIRQSMDEVKALLSGIRGNNTPTVGRVGVGAVKQVTVAEAKAASDAALADTRPLGAALLRKWESYWLEIRNRDNYHGKRASEAEEKFAYFADYWYHLHDKFAQLEKELELLPPMKANLAELCTNIGELSRRVDRLELALDMAHDINEQRQRAEWQQQRDHEITQLKAQQHKEHRDLETRFLAEKHRKQALEEQRARERNEAALIERRNGFQAQFESALNSYRMGLPLPVVAAAAAAANTSSNNSSSSRAQGNGPTTVGAMLQATGNRPLGTTIEEDTERKLASFFDDGRQSSSSSSPLSPNGATSVDDVVVPPVVPAATLDSFYGEAPIPSVTSPAANRRLQLEEERPVTTILQATESPLTVNDSELVLPSSTTSSASQLLESPAAYVASPAAATATSASTTTTTSSS